QPVCCRDPERLYLWVPLSAEVAIPPSPAAAPVPPPTLEAADDKQPDSVNLPERRKPMAAPSPNGRGHPESTRPEGQPPRGGIEDLIAEAEALREMLHDATGRTARLVAALKQQRRQARAVAAAMASLRQLQLHP